MTHAQSAETQPTQVAAVRPCWVYQYLDARENLLYVGITVDLEKRAAQHAASPFHRFIDDVRADLYGSVPEAAAIERHLIRTATPLFNRAHVRTWERPEREHRLAVYLAQVCLGSPYFHSDGLGKSPCWWCDRPRAEHCAACRACPRAAAECRSR